VRISQRKLSKELRDRIGPGGNTMVVDCGGGTIDIVVHRKEAGDDNPKELRLREVAKGTGDCCGGTVVDAAFLELLKESMPVFEQYADKYPKEVRACHPSARVPPFRACSCCTE
jgi:hypothetical protein